MNPDALARGLGWFSIGLGLAEVLLPEKLAETLGMEGKEDLIRLYGAREIAAGLGCLGGKPPTPYVWGRLAGDALDIATLGPYLSDENPKRENAAVALAAVVGVTLLDAVCAAWLTEGRTGPVNRTVRRFVDRTERRNDDRMRAADRRRGAFASEATAGSAG